MTWADGSIYKGSWQNGIQNGLGLMIFANGTKKAGIFKENVLVELLADFQTVKTQEVESNIDFPIDFKQELVVWIDE